MSSQSKPIFTVKKLVKDFPNSGGPNSIRALNDVSFELFPGEAMAVVGESGSGKSTIARILSLLHPKSSGDLVFKDAEVSGYKGDQVKHY